MARSTAQLQVHDVTRADRQYALQGDVDHATAIATTRSLLVVVVAVVGAVCVECC